MLWYPNTGQSVALSLDTLVFFSFSNAQNAIMEQPCRLVHNKYLMVMYAMLMSNNEGDCSFWKPSVTQNSNMHEKLLSCLSRLFLKQLAPRVFSTGRNNRAPHQNSRLEALFGRRQRQVSESALRSQGVSTRLQAVTMRRGASELTLVRDSYKDAHCVWWGFFFSFF